MNLTPREKDKLLIAMAAIVARKRLERGVKLNHPEAVAIISDFIMEGARDGRSVAELMQKGIRFLPDNQREVILLNLDSAPGRGTTIVVSAGAPAGTKES